MNNSSATNCRRRYVHLRLWKSKICQPGIYVSEHNRSDTRMPSAYVYSRFRCGVMPQSCQDIISTTESRSLKGIRTKERGLYHFSCCNMSVCTDYCSISELHLFTSAPAPANSRTISSCPALTNVDDSQCNSITESSLPCLPAMCRGVHPLLSALSTSALWSMRNRVMSIEPEDAAQCRGVRSSYDHGIDN